MNNDELKLFTPDTNSSKHISNTTINIIKKKPQLLICNNCIKKNPPVNCYPMVVTTNKDNEIQICGICYWERTCHHMVIFHNDKQVTMNREDIAKMLYNKKIKNDEISEHFKESVELHIMNLSKKQRHINNLSINNNFQMFD